MNGPERVWNEEGQLLIEGEYQENQPVGFSRGWYGNGQMKQEIRFYDSPEHFDRSRWSEEGDLLEQKLYYPEK